MLNNENLKLIIQKVDNQEDLILNIKFLIQILNDAAKGNEKITYLESLLEIITEKIDKLYDENQILSSICLITR